MSGWWAKFLVIFKSLNLTHKNLKIDGIVIPPGVDGEIIQKFPELRDNFDLRFDLVKKFLENKPTKKEIDFF